MCQLRPNLVICLLPFRMLTFECLAFPQLFLSLMSTLHKPHHILGMPMWLMRLLRRVAATVYVVHRAVLLEKEGEGDILVDRSCFSQRGQGVLRGQLAKQNPLCSFCHSSSMLAAKSN